MLNSGSGAAQRNKPSEKEKQGSKNRTDRLHGRKTKGKTLETDQLVDIVVGLMHTATCLLVAEAEAGHKAVNVLLSREETYADISPVRMDKNG